MALDAFISKYAGYSESYSFYDGTVKLLFDTKKHEYFLVEGGNLTLIPGASSICHIIDKSEVLINWAVKVVTDKLLAISQPYLHTVTGLSVDYLIPADFYPELIASAKKAHKDKLDEASNIGRMAHDWIESYIKYALNTGCQSIPYIPMPENEQAKSCCQAAVSWMRNHRVRWIHTEKKVYSRQHRFAGTLDGLCMADSCKDATCCKTEFQDAVTLVDWKSSNSLYPEYLMQSAAYQWAFSEEFGTEITHRWVIRLGKEDGYFESWHIEDPEDYKQDLKAFLDALSLTGSVKAVKGRLKALEDEAKLLRKAAKKASKEAAKSAECSGFKRYQGKRKPACNGGNPCQACTTKYNELHQGES